MLQKGWSKTTGHFCRAAILYYIAENLAARGDEFAQRLVAMQVGRPAKPRSIWGQTACFTYCRLGRQI